MTDAPLGLVTVRDADKTEVEKIASRDPFVVQGFRTSTVNIWEITHAGNDAWMSREPADSLSA